MEKKTLIIGVIGADVHAVGNRILQFVFTEAGFNVVNLGVMVSQEEYIAAAIETNADAIVVSSLYGQGELDCRGLRENVTKPVLWGSRFWSAATSSSENRSSRTWKNASRPWASITFSRPTRRRRRPSPL